MPNRKYDPADPRLAGEPPISDRNGEPGIPRNVDDPDYRGDEPAPRELTGRASGTGEDLTSLFANGSDEHLRDGFRSGNGDDPEGDVERNDDMPQIDR
jgi:hypothetical protein